MVNSIFQDCEQEIRNAVTVSFLRDIDPDDVVGQKIFNALPPEQQQ
jgi:MoxR-like ATPase